MSEEQQQLVSVLYSVHDKLRIIKKQAKDEQDWQTAWKEHTSDFKTLQEYSKAMHELATKIWEPRNAKSTTADDTNNIVPTTGISVPETTCRKLKCRLEWVVQCCQDYFKDRLGASGDKLKLLDVGSCYNPFTRFESFFDIVAIDLCPAPGFEDQIFQCDFLEVELHDNMKVLEEGCSIYSQISIMCQSNLQNEKYRRLACLPKNCFEVVVFSYFLEYLADAKQREESCRKAYELLDKGGILFVLRPDSSRVTPRGNNVLMKKMKIGMALIGFKRIYFEKLEHLWCMAFKKMTEDEMSKLVQGSYFNKDVRIVGAEFAIQDSSRIHELFSISQDFKQRENTSKHQDQGSNFCSLQCDQALLEELPNFEVSVKAHNALCKPSIN